MKKKDIAWLCAVLTLFCLLVVSIVLGITGYFSSMTFIKSDSDLVVGDNVTIGVRPNEANVVSFTIDGSYLPGEKLPHTIQIGGEDLNADVRVRVKAKIFGLEEENFDFITTSHFEKADDGYYYYDDVLHGGSKITFSSYLKLPSNSVLVSDEKYILTIVVETLETKFDENIWKNVQ